ncbi:MAG: pyridoxal-phosphate dependent enzyme [Pseudomonadales bacterium]|nr:pyridoxal-phosphate dependent enzyme [Pseudomonadales bacterium]
MLTADRPLFARWPKLQAKLACEMLADLPTPVRTLEKLHPNAWVKCDDMSHSEYGGNKVRKLEFILPGLQERKIRHVITIGGVGSNSGVAVALLCKRYGMACTILVFHQPASETVEKNHALMRSCGARLVYVKTAVAAGLLYYLNTARLKKDTLFLWAGCSTTEAVFAYVNAMMELQEQVNAGLCPLPASIYVAVGSCSTVAGLTLGCALLNLPVTIKGVRVAPSHAGWIPACTDSIIKKQMKAALMLLSQAYPEYSGFPLPATHLLQDYFGEGYGVETAAGARAMHIAKQRAGLSLEPTYTAKAFAAFLDGLDQNSQATLFWNTHAGAVHSE